MGLYNEGMICEKLRMAAKKEAYPSSVTDREWEIIKPLLPERGKLGRPPRYEAREMVNAIFYVTKSGCSWRMIPQEFAHWRLVYYYFIKWHRMGIWQLIHDRLREQVRLKAGKKKPLPRRLSIAKVLKWLASPESVDSMQARRSKEESDIYWLIPWG